MSGSEYGETPNYSAQLRQVLSRFRETHTKQVLRVGDDAWEYIIGGEGKRSLAMIGGGGSTAESMFSVNAALESRARVISLCIPTTASSMERVTEGIRAILVSLHMRQAILLGHSLGGMVAQCFAIRYPEQVAGLVLANTGFYLGARARLLPALSVLMARAPEKVLLRAIHSKMKRLLEPAPAAGFWRDFYQKELDQPQAGARLKHQLWLISDVSRFLRDHPISPGLPWSQSIPVQVISAEDDRGFTKRETDYLTGLYPAAEATRLPKGTGHLSFLTRPDEYVEAVQRLMARAATADTA